MTLVDSFAFVEKNALWVSELSDSITIQVICSAIKLRKIK
jgi:hypothetical protein